MHKALRYFFICILLPLIIQYICYYGFTTNYTRDAFSEAGFQKIYDTKVYKSRELGKKLHLWLYHSLNSVSKLDGLRNEKENPEHLMNTRRLSMMDAEADPVFYLTYFLIAVAFTVLTAAILMLILSNERLFPFSESYRDLTVIVFILFAGLTQFVVTPYDTVGYFFQAAGIAFFLSFLHRGSKLAYAGLLLTIAIATLNRETSLLILSVMAAVYFYRYRFDLRWLRPMILPVLCFVLPYIYLKFFQDGGAAFTDVSQVRVNLDPRNSYAIRGMAFSAFVLYFLLVTANRTRSRLVAFFLLFALPYLLIIHLVGVMIEYRLWVPVIESGLVLGMLVLPAGDKEDLLKKS